MNTDILMPILAISGIAVAAGYLLNVLEKAVAHKFDERQLIERGRGANLSMNAALMYLLGLYMGHAFDLLQPEHWSIFAVYGLIVMMMVFDAHCIFHDAFQQRGEKLGTRILSDGLLGVLWLAIALRRGAWNMEARGSAVRWPCPGCPGAGGSSSGPTSSTSGIAGRNGRRTMGKNLAMKQARTEKGLSQEALAAAVGVSRQTINAIEKGDYNPTIRLCISICRVLGLTLNDLFWEEE